MDISISCDTILSCQFTGKDDVEFKKTCYLISQDVKDGKFEVVELVKQLQNLLVNPSPTQRELGVLILTEVLTNLPVDFLSDQQLETILLFYTNKLSDHHQV
ncbi:hypothetical protein NQ318_007796 [Aromia moschata]|uniref:MMS19 nucleotide excision repair protein n=1 Tax=Aromia moschata TaxID=1265417 RepID=A0AAV8Z152_9CUCU|nr:hypothetical protein NQ318_007796 [Aromia moschata]